MKALKKIVIYYPSYYHSSWLGFEQKHLLALEGGDGPEAVEYARLKGEYEALRQSAVRLKISFDRLPPSPEEVLEDLKSRDKRR